MGILDLLMEKKDLIIYIDYRIKYLSMIMESSVLSAPEKDRESIRQRFVGRKAELQKLKDVISMDKLKDMDKTYWEKVERGENDGEENSGRHEQS